MKKIILVMSIFFGVFMGTTSFATEIKSDGYDTLDVFMNKYASFQDTYVELFGENKLSSQEREKKINDHIKELENLKKDIIVAKDSSSKTIIEDRVKVYDKVLVTFVDVLDVQISLFDFFSGVYKSGKSQEGMTASEEKKYKEIITRIDESNGSFSKAIEDFLK